MKRKGGVAGGGFTLMELLIVVAIIVLLAVIALPNMVSTLRGLQLTQAGQLVETQLQAARQRALADNRTVEVRFYKFAPRTGGTPYFTAFQQFVITSSNGVATAIDRPYYLPGSMIIDSGDGNYGDDGKTLTSMFRTPLTQGSQLQTPLGTVGTNYSCASFRFNPDGSANLVPMSGIWFLTVHAQTDGDNLTTKPVNYYTVQVDAYNGHIYDFHP